MYSQISDWYFKVLFQIMVIFPQTSSNLNLVPVLDVLESTNIKHLSLKNAISCWSDTAQELLLSDKFLYFTSNQPAIYLFGFFKNISGEIS